MISEKRKRVVVLIATTFLTTESPSDPPADPPGDNPPGDPPSDPPADDLSTIFSPEEVTAKKEALAAAKVEEERRAGLTDEQRAEEDRTKAAEAAANVAPENYEAFKVADGVVIDEELLAEFTPIAKELNLPQSKAQQIIDFVPKIVEKVTLQMHEAHANQVKAWAEQAGKDPELSADVALGEKSEAARVINTLATPELKAFLNESGLGNHPEMIRTFLRLAPMMREDGFEVGGSGSTGSGVDAKAGSIFNHPSRMKD